MTRRAWRTSAAIAIARRRGRATTGRLPNIAAFCAVGSARLGTVFVGSGGDGRDLADGHLGQPESGHRADQQSDPGECAIAAHHRRFAGWRMVEREAWLATHTIIQAAR